MFWPTRRDFIRVLAAAGATHVVRAKRRTGEAGSPGAIAGKTRAPQAQLGTLDILARHKITCERSPSYIPKAVSVDALFLGNGDLLSAFAGDAHLPQFWVTTNDFWELREWGGPRPLGRIIFDMPDLQNAGYRVEQDLGKASLTASFTAGSKAVRMISWIAATENLLVVELMSSGGSVGGKVSFRFPDELGLGVEKNDYWNYPQGGEPRIFHLPKQVRYWTDGVLTAMRTYDVGTDQPTRLVMAARFFNEAFAGTEGNTFTLEPGKRQIFVAAFQSWFKNSRPLEVARDRVFQFRLTELDELHERHQAWWSDYWNTSSVEINEPSIERQYYRSHYNMAVFSRDPDFPPCDYGICTSDDPVCCADYKVNYNYQAGFLGLNVAGHFDQTTTYDAPGLAHLSRACADAQKHLGHDGAHMSLGLAPKGTVAEHIWLGMKSQNAFYLVNTAERWYLTRDLEYARKVYPMVREVARFWEEDLRFDGNRYFLIDDAAHEDSDHHCINACSGVAFVRMAMRLIQDMSAELNLDANMRDKWQHILEHVGPIPIKDAGLLHSVFESPGISLQEVYPKGVLAGKPVIVLEEQGIDWSFECSVQTIPIYPSGEIGLDSEPGLLQAARNTVSLRSLAESQGKSWPGRKPTGIDGGAWFDSNHGCLFFTAAVRIGHDPEAIWSKLREWCEKRVWPNGLRIAINDGIENYSTVPNAIHEMMLLSHENVLRFFRVWPRKLAPDARFANLWAYGAFRVSSALVRGEVSYVRIESEKGRDCTFENPWPGRPVRVTRVAQPAKSLTGERLTIKTNCGESILLEANRFDA